jgi:hypothetical protein
MQGLLDGMNKKWSPSKTSCRSVTDKVKSTGDALADVLSQRNDFAAGFQSFGSSIFGRDPAGR